MARLLRVLVVDDNQDAAESLAMYLEMKGYEVGQAYDGLSALEAASRRPDVIFLDIGLPQIDGYEVARQLRERAETRDLVLVAVTGYNQEQDRRRCREAGFDCHLVKPVEPEELEELLARLEEAGKNRPATPARF